MHCKLIETYLPSLSFCQNVIERRSLANAIGVSVSELTKLAQGEKVLESVAQQQLSVLQSIDRGIQNLGGDGGKAGDVTASV